MGDVVVRGAFDANPSTDRYVDGPYEVPQGMLVTAAVACGIDRSDYDFTTD